jgi:1-pyrroline-5-carboxylate dehydrogenase
MIFIQVMKIMNVIVILKYIIIDMKKKSKEKGAFDMIKTALNLPVPINEKVLSYAPGSQERALLSSELEKQYQQELEIPLIIGGQEIRTGNTTASICPHNHSHVLAYYHKAGEKEIHMAIAASLNARQHWQSLSWTERAMIFLKAADLVSTKYRFVLNAATMLNQGKNPHQAEIDSTCELADFLRFNVYYMQHIYNFQPLYNAPGTWSQMEYRPLEGFIFAVSPFNFTAIAGNLASAPAIMGNVVVWKPASTAVLSGYYLMQIFKEAGLPDGVINFIPGPGNLVGPIVFSNPDLGGIHFTGSTQVFNDMWKVLSDNIDKYKSYPRMVGETGGKNFVFLHSSANVKAASVALIRGAFEYHGQKCSAASRAYIPRSIWESVLEGLLPYLEDIVTETGDPADFKFFNALIDESAFDSTMVYIDKAKKSDQAQVVFGGNGDKSTGYFIEPTLIVTSDPHFITMEEEIFAPVLTVFLYDDDKYEETLELCDQTSPYALTGAIFAENREAVSKAREILKNAAGAFYINDKTTGSVVGQQPFGGSRKSGTNDKSGFYLNLIRWVSPRIIKENFTPDLDYRYPFMEQNHNI